MRCIRFWAATVLLIALASVSPLRLEAQDATDLDEQFVSVTGPGSTCELRRTGPTVVAIVTTPVQPPLGGLRGKAFFISDGGIVTTPMQPPGSRNRTYCQVPEGFRPLTGIRQEAVAYIGDPSSSDSDRAGSVEFVYVDPDGTVINAGGRIEDIPGGRGSSGASFALEWFTATHAADGVFANLAEHHGGQFQVLRGGHHVRAHIATDRSPVQHWARQEPAKLFQVPEGFRPHMPVVRTVEGTVVDANGTLFNPSRVVAFEITVTPDGAVRYVDGELLDDVGYLAYTIHMVWETAVSPDRAVLEDLMAKADFHLLRIYANFNWGRADVPLAQWSGVSTDAFGRVTHLELQGFGGSGDLPPSVGRLSALRTLDLSNGELISNSFTSVPATLSELVHLEHLILDGQPVTGTLPAAWSRLTNLRTLSLRWTDFTGPLPPEWSEFQRLEVLDLGYTHVEGYLPPEWGSMRNLEALVFSSPYLEGPLPAEWATMPRLRGLDIRGTPLTGPLPPEWSRMPQLVTVHLWHTNIDPVVPPVWSMSRSLRSVQVDNLQTHWYALRREYIRDLLLAHDSAQTRAESGCRDGYVTYLHHCRGTEPEPSVAAISD